MDKQRQRLHRVTTICRSPMDVAQLARAAVGRSQHCSACCNDRHGSELCKRRHPYL